MKRKSNVVIYVNKLKRLILGHELFVNVPCSYVSNLTSSLESKLHHIAKCLMTHFLFFFKQGKVRGYYFYTK